MADAPDLDARAIVAQRFLQAPLDQPVVAPLVHVDEVDDDQPGEVAQAKLARDLIGRLEIGLERGVLDIVLARRLAGVDVDRDERLGLIDDDIAARSQHDLRREHRRELPLDLKADEDRLGLLVGLHVLGMARHEHAHEVLGLAIGVVAGDQDFVDVLVVEVADRALDQAAFLIDEGRGRRFQREIAHVLPQPQQIVVVALDLGLGALGAGGADDEPHAFRHFELARDLAQALAVGGLRDLARDAAAARGVRHQHGVAAGKRKIGRERRALIAALFLHHLHEDDLAAPDHLLDLVGTPAAAAGPLGQFLERVFRADRFDGLGDDVAVAFFHRHRLADGLARLVVVVVVVVLMLRQRCARSSRAPRRRSSDCSARSDTSCTRSLASMATLAADPAAWCRSRRPRLRAVPPKRLRLRRAAALGLSRPLALHGRPRPRRPRRRRRPAAASSSAASAAEARLSSSASASSRACRSATGIW